MMSLAIPAGVKVSPEGISPNLSRLARVSARFPDMGLFKWAAKTTYYTGKKAVRGAGRSIARDIRSVAHPTYEHAGCSIRHRSAEAMLKCRKGSDYVPAERTRSSRQRSSGSSVLLPHQMICGSCASVIPLELVTCPNCSSVLLDEPCIGCGGTWRMTRLNGDLAGFCERCNWYVTSEGLVRTS
jgi:hypothetical protein